MQIEMLKYNTCQCSPKSKHHEVHIAENALQGLRGSHCEIEGVGLVQESKGRRVGLHPNVELPDGLPESGCDHRLVKEAKAHADEQICQYPSYIK